MTAIKPTDSALRDKIEADEYNEILNNINARYAEMDKFIGNLESDIGSVNDFIKDVLVDQEQGYDVGTSLDTLTFQKDSLEIDNNFFKHMKQVYIRKLYGDLYKYCDGIIESALAIEVIPADTTREQVKTRKFRNLAPFPARMVTNPKRTDADGNVVEDEPELIPDPDSKYDMNEIFALINCTTSNLRELAEDIGSFDTKITRAKERETRGFSVGNLIMNLESQKQKLVLEFASYIIRLKKFLLQNQNFSTRCLNRIKMISSEIVTAEELRESEEEKKDETTGDATDGT
tara:strand:- start:6616 stop:7482 length:867 start_codon:yes stop_codon:yes gene_type:complete